MKTANISELKNQLSRFLAYVRRGGTVRIFDRDLPVADLVPCSVSDASSDAGALLDDLERIGVVRRGRAKLPRDFLTRTLPVPGASVVEALLAERAEGR